MSGDLATRLERCEAIIQAGLNTFVEVGSALMSIREGRLYRVEYSTFEDYCRERWGMTRKRAYDLMGAAETVELMSPIGDILPANEGQARELSGLDPETAAEVMDLAAESGKITAASIRDARETITKPTPASTPVEDVDDFEPEDDELAHLAVDRSTGEILDDGPSRAGRAAADSALDAVNEFIESGPNRRRLILQRDLVRAIAGWVPPIGLEPEEAASLPLDEATLLLMRHRRAGLVTWLDAFDKARKSGLKLIAGGQS